MKKYQFVSTITEEEIDNIMSSALRGCGYWCDEVKLIGETNKDIMYSQVLTNGLALKIRDEIAGRWYKLDIDRFLKAVSKVDNHNFDSYDLIESDNLLQIALFGKVKYS